MAYNFSKVSVLVVESSREMFNLFKGVLKMLEVPDRNLHAAYSPEEAIERFTKINHDLIITDWLQNPDRGIILTKSIRMNAKTGNRFVPIIMTAGSGHKNRVIRARDAGISEYLVKPFSADGLATRITRVIEKPRPFVVSENYVGPDRRVRVELFEGEDRRKNRLEAVKE
ncbi:MAG: response regulator [Alphaproteobacteria bacterium]|nr:response regulator [Alphaproteobacteria bacterium]